MRGCCNYLGGYYSEALVSLSRKKINSHQSQFGILLLLRMEYGCLVTKVSAHLELMRFFSEIL